MRSGNEGHGVQVYEPYWKRVLAHLGWYNTCGQVRLIGASGSPACNESCGSGRYVSWASTELRFTAGTVCRSPAAGHMHPPLQPLMKGDLQPCKGSHTYTRYTPFGKATPPTRTPSTTPRFPVQLVLNYTPWHGTGVRGDAWQIRLACMSPTGSQPLNSGQPTAPSSVAGCCMHVLCMYGRSACGKAFHS